MELFRLLISLVGYAVETAGVIVIVIGIIRATRRSLGTDDRDTALRKFRHEFARSTLVGMDFLIAGDIIRTVIVSHTLDAILTLGVLVLIRTVLVFTLHLELEGRWPWQGAADNGTDGGERFE